MIAYLYGPDSLRRLTKLKGLLVAVRSKSSGSEEWEVDLEENSDAWSDVRDFANQQSIFGGTKVMVVKEAASCDEKEWIKFLKEMASREGAYLFASDSAKPTKAFHSLLEQPSESYEFGELAGKELSDFVKSEIAKRSISFSEEAFKFFLSFLAREAGNRSWTAVQEIEKASLLGKKEVALSDLLGVSVFPEFDEVWRLSRQVLSASPWTEKVRILEKLFSQGADSSYIFNSLAFGAAGKDVLKLSDYDVLIKSGKLDFPEALLGFVLESA